MAASLGASSRRSKIVVDVSDECVPDDEVLYIYRWLDSLPFSRNKKTSAHRDFADGVMMAELIAHYIPKIVNTRNYFQTSSTAKKRANWEHLNSKVFCRIRFQLTPAMVKEVADAKPGMIERVLRPLQVILLMGPLAVTAPSKRLENVKSRFLDPPRKIAAASSGRSTTARRPSSSHSDHQFVSARSETESRPTSVKSKSKPSKSRSRPSSLSAVNEDKKLLSNLPVPVKTSTENYEVLTRPSTGRSDNGSESMDLAHRPLTADCQKARPLPSNTSWLPVLVDNNADKSRNMQLQRGEDFRDADFELDLCDENGEDDDDIDEIMCYDYDDDHDEDARGSADNDTDLNNNQKRKIKRVVKYEYREEYILNGVTKTSASFRAPTSTDMDRPDSFGQPTIKEPKSRALSKFK